MKELISVIFSIILDALKPLLIFLGFMSPLFIIRYRTVPKFYDSGVRAKGTVTCINVSTKTYKDLRTRQAHTYHLHYPVVRFELDGFIYELESYEHWPERTCPFPGTEVRVAISDDFRKVKILNRSKILIPHKTKSRSK